MTAMNDDELGRLLKKLPRREASPEFTDRLMERLDEPPPRRYRPVSSGAARAPQAWVLAGACVVVFFAWFLGVTFEERNQRHQRRQTAERVEMMRDEYRALLVELEELRSLASEARPVLDLGGTEQVDFVFDLRRLAEEGGAARAQPTSHSPP